MLWELFLLGRNTVIRAIYEWAVCRTLWHSRAQTLQPCRIEGLNCLHHHLIANQPSRYAQTQGRTFILRYWVIQVGNKIISPNQISTFQWSLRSRACAGGWGACNLLRRGIPEMEKYSREQWCWEGCGLMSVSSVPGLHQGRRRRHWDWTLGLKVHSSLKQGGGSFWSQWEIGVVDSGEKGEK